MQRAKYQVAFSAVKVGPAKKRRLLRGLLIARLGPCFLKDL